MGTYASLVLLLCCLSFSFFVVLSNDQPSKCSIVLGEGEALGSVFLYSRFLADSLCAVSIACIGCCGTRAVCGFVVRHVAVALVVSALL